MNRAQRDLLDEIGLGALLAILWSVCILIFRVIQPTPTMRAFALTATIIAFLFAASIGLRWLYLGQSRPAPEKRKGNRR